MVLENGYEFVSTFPMDFSIADAFGVEAVKDTYNRAFTEWKSNHVYLTELVITLNLKIWQWWQKDNNSELAKVYDELWRKTHDYALDNLKDEELTFYLRTVD